MPNYIATANGNLTAGATWASTAEFTDGTASQFLTTAYAESQAFTPGAVQIDGIAVKIATRADVPSGTISVRLAQAGALVAGTEVTVNVSDILGTVLDQIGWMFFKFGAPVTLAAATPYTVSARTSVASMVSLYRVAATAADWLRMVRTTTTGVAPVAGDTLFVLGEWTSAGTKTDRAVTMDNTAATDFGSASTTLASFGISNGGSVTWGTAAATAYLLRVSGLLDVWVGGVLNMGTVATPCPRNSSMQLEFDCAADGDFGLRVWGTWNGQGQSRIAGSDNHFALLNTDEAAGQTVLGTDRQLSGRSGDDVVITSTTRTNTECEARVLSADAGAADVTVTVGLTNAHSGTSPTQAEVFVLNRDVRVRSVSTTAMAYINLHTGCTVDCDWIEVRYCGTPVANKRAITWVGESGSVNFNKCSTWNTESSGFYADLAAGVGAFTLTDHVFWQVGTTGTNYAVEIAQATTAVWTVTGCVGAGTLTVQNGYCSLDLGGTLQNCRWAGGQAGFRLGEATSNQPAKITGTFDALRVHSTASNGFFLENIAGGRMSNLTVWRTSGVGVNFSGSSIGKLLIDTLIAFGCSVSNVLFTSGGRFNDITFRNSTIAADTSFAVTNGINVNATMIVNLVLENCDLGVTSGIFVAHTQDINLLTTPKFFTITLVACNLASATEISNRDEAVCGGSFVAYQKHEDVVGAHSVVYPTLGTVALDTVTFRTASPSERLTPTGSVAGFRLLSTSKGVAVPSGQSATVSVFVNKSASYSGSSPRLRVAANPAAGVNEATVATHAGGPSTWVQLQGTVGPVTEDCWLEFFVDCDGSAGQVNADDYTSSVA